MFWTYGKISHTREDTMIEEQSVQGHTLTVNSCGGKSSKLDVDWTLLPSVYDLREVIKVLTENCDEHGGDYPRNNWRKLSVSTNFNHLIDHTLTSLQLSDCDPAYSYEELTHACARLLFLLVQLRERTYTK